MRRLLFTMALAAAAAAATDRSQLNGTWHLSSEPDGKLKFETILIQQTADEVTITESGGKEKAVDLTCGLDAKECKLKEGQISFWYNGDALVMMEMHHNRDQVVKTRLIPGDDGKTLSLEITHVVPVAVAAKYVFKKE